MESVALASVRAIILQRGTVDSDTLKEIQERLDQGKDLNEPMVEALHSDPAETTQDDENNFQIWLESRAR